MTIYIATSTFEWYPGVQIHHSRNLRDWTLPTRPLRRANQLDLRGEPDFCGVWVPCLSYADELFWLVYTDVKRFDGNFKDAHNYLVNTSDIRGDWSDPVYLNSSGFDTSLFHNDDDRKWLLNLVWNYRATSLGESPRHSPFGGIALQEYSHSDSELIGKPTLIFTGTDRGLTDEGILQRTGHGQVVQTASGEWYHTSLLSPFSRIQAITVGTGNFHPALHLGR